MARADKRLAGSAMEASRGGGYIAFMTEGDRLCARAELDRVSLLVSLALVLAPGCEVTTRPVRDTGGGGELDGGGVPVDAPRPTYDVPFDPFAPDTACGATAIPTSRIPGSLLLVFDRSTSMDEDPQGDRPGDRDFTPPSKWDLCEETINAVLGATGDDLGAGLLLFPSGEGRECDVTLSAGVPHVPIAPLSSSRAPIRAALAGGTDGGVTPILDALRAGWAYLDGLDTAGPKGVILVTDGAENCDAASLNSVLAEARERNDVYGYLTYAIGLDNSSDFLSTLAENGGTARNDTCMGTCVGGIRGCASPADCMPGESCFFGFCTSTATPDCCHYDVSESSFRTDFETVLDQIAQRFLDSCVFELPRGSDPMSFDPSLVNVGVTFTGESRTVVGRSSDPTVSSWDFTSMEHESIVLQGPICDRLLAGDATVEIVLGCPTILY